MRALIIILVFILNSCALYNKYEYGQHIRFKNSLSKEEKKEIENKGIITKRWSGYNNRGDSLNGDILIKKGYPYEFIEIGDWKERTLLTRSDKKIGIYKKELKYDPKGNLIFMKSYFKKWKTDNYFLIEQMESTFDPKGLKQTFKGFYDTGELQFQYTLLVADYQTDKSDHLREKELEEPIKYFDKNGVQISGLPANTYFGIIKFTKMK